MKLTSKMKEIKEELLKIRKLNNPLKKESKLKEDINRDFETKPQELYFELSTSRNRQLITKGQQNVLRKTVVSFFGLSVGSHAALTWLMQGRADTVKIIDPDTFSATNLNRVRFGWDSVGKYKAVVVGTSMKQIHPYVNVISSIKTDSQSTEFIVNQFPDTHIIVEEIDNFAGKLLLRQIAKKKHIPLISATDVGDNVFLDVERYDLDPQPDFFLGRVEHPELIDFDSLTPKERMKLIISIVGLEHNSEAMLVSLLSVGKTITTWPQLGATATIAGGVIATTIKKIRLGEHIESGRYYISLDSLLNKNNDNKLMTKKRTLLKNKIIALLK